MGDASGNEGWIAALVIVGYLAFCAVFGLIVDCVFDWAMKKSGYGSLYEGEQPNSDKFEKGGRDDSRSL